VRSGTRSGGDVADGPLPRYGALPWTGRAEVVVPQPGQAVPVHGQPVGPCTA